MPKNEIFPEQQTLTIDSEINVFPIGLKYSNALSQKIFPENRFPSPKDFSQSELKQLSNLYWSRRNNKTELYFDFKNQKHIYELLLGLENFKDSALDNSIFLNSKNFLNTLDYYVERANLTEAQQKILELKLKKITN